MQRTTFRRKIRKVVFGERGAWQEIVFFLVVSSMS
jgi:hypothetical protein